MSACQINKCINMCQTSMVIEVVRLLKRITFLLNKKVEYYSQISSVMRIMGI